MKTPKCGHCGNDGTEGALYLTIDAQWDAERQAWLLREREDEGGGELDCLACDKRTAVRGDRESDPNGPSGFPYGVLLQPDGTKLFRSDLVTPADDDSDLAEAADGETCDACGRASIDCSRDPCAAVIRDREESSLGDVRTFVELLCEAGYELHTDMVADIARATDPDALGIEVHEPTAFIIRSDYEGNGVEKWVTVNPNPNDAETEFTRIE